jgi:hypothetical protein
MNGYVGNIQVNENTIIDDGRYRLGFFMKEQKRND